MLTPSQNRRESAWLTPRTLIHALWARAGFLLLVTLIVFACLAALIYTLPKGYQSEMELLVAPLGGPAQPATNSPGAETPDTQINSEIELLRSTNVLNSVVLKAGLQKLELAEDNHRDETSPVTIERALQRLRKNLEITPVKNSEVVRATYSGPSPEIARDVLRTLAEIYQQRRAQLHTADAGYDFLHRQSAGWKDLLAKAEVDLQRYRRTYSGFVLPEEREAFEKRAIEARAAAEQADAQAAQYTAKVRTEKELLQEMPANSAATLQKGKKSPFVHVAYRWTNANMPLLNAADASRLQARHVQDEVELSSVQALRDRLKQVADRYRAEIRQLAVVSVEHDSLLRKVKVGETFYHMYKEKEENARVAQVLTRDLYENVSLADGPTLPAEPSTPHLLNDLLIALACSFACGIAVVLLVEFFTAGHIRSYDAVRSAMLGLE